MRQIVRSSLTIAIITLMVWLVRQFIQPILPIELNSNLVLIIAVLIGVAAFLASLKDTLELDEMLQQYHNQHILTSELGQGPYDKATILQSTKYYIKPKCSNIDPAQEEEARHALIATKEDLFEKVDSFLDQDTPRHHLLVLAESGMGKTSFALNYYAHNARRSKKKRHKLSLIPLGIKDADNLISKIPDPKNTVLFLDALDEDMKAVMDHRTRISALMEACRDFKRVIITCRTQFFPKDEEIPVSTGISIFAPRKAGERSTYEFWKLYLSPFDDRDVARYVRKRFPVWNRQLRKKASDTILKIPLLSVRPMLLAYVPDVVSSSVRINYSYQLYEVMIDAWLERESTWVDKDKMRNFSEKLAVDIYRQRERRGSERIPYEELLPLARLWNLNLEQWQISGRSLLNRDTEGNYKFAHRSIMEYLFVKRLVNGDEDCVGITLTDQMRKFFLELLSPLLPPGHGLRRDFLTIIKGLQTDMVVGYIGKSQPTFDTNWVFASMTTKEIQAFKHVLHTLSDLFESRPDLYLLLDYPTLHEGRPSAADLDQLTFILSKAFPIIGTVREVLVQDRGFKGIHHSHTEQFLSVVSKQLIRQLPSLGIRQLVEVYGFRGAEAFLKLNQSEELKLDMELTEPYRVMLKIKRPSPTRLA